MSSVISKLRSVLDGMPASGTLLVELGYDVSGLAGTRNQDLLRRWASDSSYIVRHAVSRNPHATPEAIATVLARAGTHVDFFAVLGRAQLEPWCFMAILGLTKSEGEFEYSHGRWRWMDDMWYEPRAAALGHQSCPAELVAVSLSDVYISQVAARELARRMDRLDAQRRRYLIDKVMALLPYEIRRVRERVAARRSDDRYVAAADRSIRAMMDFVRTEDASADLSTAESELAAVGRMASGMGNL